MLSAFISYSYQNELSQTIAREVRAICEALHIKPLDGQDVVAAIELSSQIEARIKACQVLIVIAPNGVLSQYVDQEVGCAAGLSIPVILVTDVNDVRGGLVAEKYKIVRIQNDRFKYAVTLTRTLQSIIRSGTFLFHDTGDTNSDDSKEIYQDLRSFDLFNAGRRKHNYSYDIIFGDKRFCESVDPAQGFYSVRFRIRFEAVLSDPELYIECARTEDNFQTLYKQLVRQSESVYRYIMKTSKNVAITPDVFVVERLEVDGKQLPVFLDSDLMMSDQYLRYRSAIPEADRARLVGQQVSIEIEICTIADRDRNEFTAIFGYPVKNLDTSFLAETGDITDIDVVDVISARKPAEKAPMGDARRSGAKVRVRGWMLPDSAVIYVWNRKAA